MSILGISMWRSQGARLPARRAASGSVSGPLSRLCVQTGGAVSLSMVCLVLHAEILVVHVVERKILQGCKVCKAVSLTRRPKCANVSRN